MIALSGSTPRARININRGIGFLTLGITATICPFEYVVDGRTIRTENVLTGFDVSSAAHLISAAAPYNSLTLPLTYNILSANFSWGTMHFSLPSIIKYPP